MAPSQNPFLRFSISFAIFNLIVKLVFSGYRLLDVLRLFPLRLGRFVQHFLQGIYALPELYAAPPVSILFWWLEAVLLLLELTGITEIYESLADLIKFNTRPLRDWEIQMARQVYGSSIRYHRVRIDEAAFLGPRQSRFCYVSFYTINSWGPMSNSILMHELMHVWQFQHVGIVYIPRALRAYFSKENYNYGGLSQLEDYRSKALSILDFNFEQQGDIVADYYRLNNGYTPNWGTATRSDLPVYQYFIDQLKRKGE